MLKIIFAVLIMLFQELRAEARIRSESKQKPTATWISDEQYRKYLQAQTKERITPEAIRFLEPNEVFVFGSNDRGAHNGGAARLAVQRFGARMGVASGPQGQCYAIPTVGAGIGPDEIRAEFHRLVEYAVAHPEKIFLVTALGCGHGGYDPDTMSRMLEEGINVPNIHFPMAFWNEFKGRGLV